MSSPDFTLASLDVVDSCPPSNSLKLGTLLIPEIHKYNPCNIYLINNFCFRKAEKLIDYVNPKCPVIVEIILLVQSLSKA